MMVLSSPRPAGSTIQGEQTIAISFVIDSLSRAGTESQLLALIRELDRNRFTPSLVVLNGTDSLSRSLEPNCPVLRLEVKKLGSASAIAAARKLNRFWSIHKPDIVQAYFLDSAYFAAPIARWRGAKVLRVRNNLGYWKTRKHRLLDRCVRPFVTATLTNCEAGRDALLKEGYPIDRVIVLENGVDCTPLRSHRIEYDIVCVANLRSVKNIDGLLRAMVIVREAMPEVCLAIAGDGPEKESLLALRETLQLQSHVQFLGSVRDVPGLLQSARVAVLPSHSEGLSNALLEAMASARVIVATDVGANRRVLGDAGVIVPPRNDAALGENLLQLLGDPSRCETLGRAARRRVERHFSREAMRKRFEEFYTSLAGR